MRVHVNCLLAEDSLESHKVLIDEVNLMSAVQLNLYKMVTQKMDKIKILITIGSLMKVESIAECSTWSILQYFEPALGDSWS